MVYVNDQQEDVQDGDGQMDMYGENPEQLYSANG
jgi:hypothetical protein